MNGPSGSWNGRMSAHQTENEGKPPTSTPTVPFVHEYQVKLSIIVRWMASLEKCMFVHVHFQSIQISYSPNSIFTCYCVLFVKICYFSSGRTVATCFYTMHTTQGPYLPSFTCHTLINFVFKIKSVISFSTNIFCVCYKVCWSQIKNAQRISWLISCKIIIASFLTVNT